MIYLDNCATTELKEEVLEAMMPYFKENYGNASSFYNLGAKARTAIDGARDHIASMLGAKYEELFFVSCGSEADNWALMAKALESGKKHIISSKIEHHAVLNTLKFLEEKGFSVTYLSADDQGKIDEEEFEKAITDDTLLASIMYVNNETGVIQPVKNISDICKDRNIFFHSDCVQALGSVKLNLDEMNLSAAAFSAHKVHGPKGIGLFYLNENEKIKSYIHGGGQERGLRAGTENVAYIVGMEKAIEICYKDFENKENRLKKMRDNFEKTILSSIYGAKINGRGRVSKVSNIYFPNILGERFLMMLDLHGIMASSGSACQSGSNKPSHVIEAMTGDYEYAKSSIRFSFSDLNTEEEIERATKIIIDLYHDSI